ncbi:MULTISPECIES: heptaprenyl diphosphate synthase component 1 [Sporosarcina]|uniref:heptaprenyl diphosphate synthase component 1 n=1 Tax=Sporosarcina TaxID=1569 RepID=UPI00058F03F5|nr:MULTISPECIES: heptaprenyl diphosphate synthase component 1 [Sporosarcina]WJY28597.1 heptaprenyl diphosphate synthase component 1 [Sporosarcina sp. 0.2-SM1T-5]
MNKQQLDTFIENYMAGLRSALKEPTLDREIADVPLDRDKAFYLLLPLLNDGMTADRPAEEVMIAVGAIQAALDIHDRIEKKGAASAVQQLTVLAGDHFSGVHYKLLADIGEFTLIRELSQTIGRVNEQKAALQTDSRLTAERLLSRLAVIETACISTFYDRYGYDRYRKLAEYALTYIRLHDPEALKSFGVEEELARRAVGLLGSRWQSETGQAAGLSPVLADTVQDRLHSLSSSS